MCRYLAILLASLTFLSSSAKAAEVCQADLSWTEPTLNDDGSPLTDLTSYEIWNGCDQSGVYDTVKVVLAPANNYTVSDLPCAGTCYFAAKATNSVGASSVFSNEAPKLMGMLSVPPDSDSINVTWEESVVVSCPGCIDFATVTISPFSNQDRDRDFTVLNNGASIRLDNNTWLQTDTIYTITLNTVVEFTFESSVQGEIQGLGFDEDSEASSKRIFHLYGTQDWGRSGFTYTGVGRQTFKIPVGQYYSGNGFHLILVNDDDSGIGANGTFSDVRVYEE